MRGNFLQFRSVIVRQCPTARRATPASSGTAHAVSGICMCRICTVIFSSLGSKTGFHPDIRRILSNERLCNVCIRYMKNIKYISHSKILTCMSVFFLRICFSNKSLQGSANPFMRKIPMSPLYLMVTPLANCKI